MARRFTEAERAEIWERLTKGESGSMVARPERGACGRPAAHRWSLKLDPTRARIAVTLPC
jgi:hypothetical protein